MEKFGLGTSSLCNSLAVQPTEDANAGNPSAQDPPTIPDAVKSLFYNEIVVQGEENEETTIASIKNFYEAEVKVSREQAVKIMIDTQQQSFSPAWHNERKKRVSASKAHQIANARKEETALKYFQHVTSDHVNLQYGRTMESVAKEAYKKVSGNIIHTCGLFVKPCQPWMSCTPDGIAQDSDGNLIVLEIKCPISCQRSKISVPWLSEDGLKETHPYYCQVQIQLYCCNLDKAHFFVFSENDSVLVEIMRNDAYL